MPLADVIDLVYVPDHVDRSDGVMFPVIDPLEWDAGPLLPHEDEPALQRRVYTRKLGVITTSGT